MSRLFSIYHPYSFSGWTSFNSWCSIFELLFQIQMYPTKPINNEYVYNVFIKNNTLHSFRSSKIDKFIKNDTNYLLFSNEYDAYRPLLTVTLYEDTIWIQLTTRYSAYLSGLEMNECLTHLQQSYAEYKNNLIT
jgi:hypothetical protein